MQEIYLQYLFDPLCGWCYACAPAITAVAKRWPGKLELLPCGLFSETGARSMTPEWARYAWDNDQRIGGMTGQRFNELYLEKVLGNAGGKFDSSAMNRALTVVHAIDPRLELKLLNALQVARYIEGRDTCSYAVVSGLAAHLMISEGHEENIESLNVRLYTDEDLAKRTYARISTAQALIRRFDLRGIPQLLVRAADITILLDSSKLYHGVEKLLVEIQRTTERVRASAV